MAGRKNLKRAKYLDMSLPVEKRVDDLVGRLTTREKVLLMLSKWWGVKRLGIPAYSWGGECLHGLVHTGRATVFPQVIGLAATFDTDLVQRVASAIADEARAKYHDPVWHGPGGPRVGLNFWTPNINIFRDPRWGRGQETYGEDPHLTGSIGAAFVRGLQGDHPRYLKVAACAKHLAAHSGPDRLRTSFNALVGKKDLAETYLPAFRELVRAGAAVVMATYNRVNGEPCCGSRTLLVDILRGRWNFQGQVVSDGGAISAIHKNHRVTRNAMESAALAVSMGCDMELAGVIGSARNFCYWHLGEALRKGMVAMADIDRSVRRILATLFRLGIFDDPEKVPYAKIKSDVIQCRKHIAMARESAVKSMVLLKNNGVLPFGRRMHTILVTGPNAADADVLLGNFYRGVSANLKTVLEGIIERAPEGTAVTTMKGCHLNHPNEYPSDWIKGLAEWADAVVAVVGVSPLMEGEAGECIAARDGADRDQLEVPANQVEFVKMLAKAGKPIVLVVTGGSPVSLGELEGLADAILHVWYPGEQGGTAVGDILFGHESPSGRLPVTFPKSYSQLPPAEDYSMRGRTYRYMTEEPLYPFGFGLSYAKFRYGRLKLSARRIRGGGKIVAETRVTNVGRCTAEEVVQLYLADNEASVPWPRWALKGFRRVSLQPGQSKTVRFVITPEMMEMIDNEGRAVLEPGTFTVFIGGSSPGPRSRALGAPKPAKGKFTLL